MCDDTQQLFTHLTALQSLPRTRPMECRRVAATIGLMLYLQQSQRLDMFEKYQQNLWLLHADLDNQVERGLALVQVGLIHYFFSSDCLPAR